MRYQDIDTLIDDKDKTSKKKGSGKPQRSKNQRQR